MMEAIHYVLKSQQQFLDHKIETKKKIVNVLLNIPDEKNA